jgi:hypothetical protein
VPGKIQEFLLVTVDACPLSEKIQGWLVYLLSTEKNRTSLSHSELILEFFKV